MGYFLVDVSKIRERFDELSTPILKSGRLYQLASFTQHGTTSTLDHVIAVAYSSLAFAMNAGIKVDEHALVRGALLHDYYHVSSSSYSTSYQRGLDCNNLR